MWRLASLGSFLAVVLAVSSLPHGILCGATDRMASGHPQSSAGERERKQTGEMLLLF